LMVNNDQALFDSILINDGNGHSTSLGCSRSPLGVTRRGCISPAGITSSQKDL
jgi:hypothetical protein